MAENNIKKKKIKKSDIPFIIGAVIGIALFVYPIAGNMYYKYQFAKVNKNFENVVQRMGESEIDRKIELAEEYNKELDRNEEISIDGADISATKKEYIKMMKSKQRIGYVEIPKIGQKMAIYLGTNEDVLEIGAGHMPSTSLPIGGKGNHSVIVGHSGLPKKLMFTGIRSLRAGDVFFIRNVKGKMAYKVDRIEVVKPDDFSKLIRIHGKDYCTLMTCTPYMINTHRLLVRGERTDYNKAVKESLKKKILFLITVAIVITLIAVVIKTYKNKKIKIS